MSLGGGGESANNEIIAAEKESAAQAGRDTSDRNSRIEHGRKTLGAVFGKEGGTVGPYSKSAEVAKIGVRPSWTNTATGNKTYANPNQNQNRTVNDRAKMDYERRGGPSRAAQVPQRTGGGGGGGGDWNQVYETYDTGEKEWGTENVGGTKKYSGIGDDFYDKYYDTISDHYGKDVKEQHGEAKKQNLFDLARSGLLRSSESADRAGDLQRELGVANLAVADRAQQGRDGLVNQVNQNRKSAELALQSVEDPTDVINAAVRDANAIQSSSPDLSGGMGNMFANAFNAYTNYNNVNNARKYNAATPSPRAPTTSSGVSYA